MVAASVGAGLLPTKTVARVNHRHTAARVHNFPTAGFGYGAPPVFYRAEPPLQYSPPVHSVGAGCDIARDWNC
jgi:hypothetical protein